MEIRLREWRNARERDKGADTRAERSERERERKVQAGALLRLPTSPGAGN